MAESFLGALFEIVLYIFYFIFSCRCSSFRPFNRWRKYVNKMWPFFSYTVRLSNDNRTHAHTTHVVPYLSLRRLLNNNNLNKIRTIWDKLKVTRKTWCCLRRQWIKWKKKKKKYIQPHKVEHICACVCVCLCFMRPIGFAFYLPVVKSYPLFVTLCHFSNWFRYVGPECWHCVVRFCSNDNFGAVIFRNIWRFAAIDSTQRSKRTQHTRTQCAPIWCPESQIRIIKSLNWNHSLGAGDTDGGFMLVFLAYVFARLSARA